MKLKIALVVVALVALGLGIALVKSNQDAAKDHADLTTNIFDLSNSLSTTTVNLEEQKKKNESLETDVSNQVSEIADLTNKLVAANQSIQDKDSALKAAEAQAEVTEKQIMDYTNTINQLEAETTNLQGQIQDKNQQIADIQKKLDASEGDRVFLEKEYQRLTAEKAELERKFNDLAVLKDQVRKLKEDADVARRLAWIRAGLYDADQKGATKLMQSASVSSGRTAPAPTNTYDLNVEVKSDGSVQVIPPLPATNAPGDSTSPAAK